MKLIIAFLTALPELLRFVKMIQEEIRKSEENRKVRDDIAKIREAFASGDKDKLNSVFGGPK